MVDPGHPAETAAFFAQNQLPAFPVGDAQGSHLMHHKYLLVDAGTPAARLWAGSANITTAAFTRQENNLLDIASPELVQAYAANFEELWKTRNITGSGAGGGGSAVVDYEGEAAAVEVRFAPGQGAAIDHEVAERLRAAQREVTVASVVLSSGHILGALTDVVARGVPLSGVVDIAQMDGHRRAVALQSRQRVEGRRLHGAGELRSPPRQAQLPRLAARAPRHMHNKVLVVDTTVITGSYNYSVNAQSNAENILFIESPSLALAYRAYIQRLVLRYPPV